MIFIKNKNIDVYLKYYKNGEKNTQGYNIHKEIEEYKAIKQEYDDIKDELKDIKKNKYYYDTMEREHKRLKDFALYRIKKDLDYILREHIIKEKNIELDDTKIEIYKENVDKYTKNTKYLLSSVNNTKEFEEDKLDEEDYLRIVLKNEVFSILKNDTNKKHKDISNFYKEQSQKDSEDRAELNKKVKEERKDRRTDDDIDRVRLPHQSPRHEEQWDIIDERLKTDGQPKDIVDDHCNARCTSCEEMRRNEKEID